MRLRTLSLSVWILLAALPLLAADVAAGDRGAGWHVGPPREFVHSNIRMY